MEKENMFLLMILFLAIYNIFYGAFCWIIGGTNGLLFGSILMVVGGIIGVVLRNSEGGKS